MKAKVKDFFDKSDNQGKMALDLVESGDDVNLYGRQEKVNKKLPDGIHSRMLYNDVVKIAWPSFVELTLTQLASMVDLMMVGSLGSWAISAVGLTMQPKFLTSLCKNSPIFYKWGMNCKMFSNYTNNMI